MLEPQRAVAVPQREIPRVGRQHEDFRVPQHGIQSRCRLGLEILVSHAQPLVHHENLRTQHGGHGESQPQLHARGVGAHGEIDEVAQFREFDDFLQVFLNKIAPESQDGRAQKDVLAACGLGIRAERDIDERADGAGNLRRSTCGSVDAGQRPEECGFSRPIVAKECDPFTRADAEVQVRQCLHDDVTGVIRGHDAACGDLDHPFAE